MEPERKTPGPAATGTEGCIMKSKQSESSTQEPSSQEEGALRTALLAELRQDFILTKFDLLEIERLGIALKNGLISVRQCLALQRDPTTWGTAS